MIYSIFKISIVIFVINIITIYIDSGEYPKESVDFAIIYGNKVKNKLEPSNRLKARLDACISLYNSLSIKKIIVSGGVDDNGFDESFVMQNYLVENGIGMENIIKDSLGINTHTTSKNLEKLINKNDSIVAISQKYHISRIKLSLKNNGYKNIYTHYPNYYEIRDIYSIIRELPAWIKYYIFKL